MKLGRKLTVAILSLSFLSAWADLPPGRRIDRQFMIANISEYKDSIYFDYLTYNQGSNKKMATLCKENTRYSASDIRLETFLYIKGIKEGFYKFISEPIGGTDRVSNTDIETIVDVYSIISIDKRKINLKKTAEITVYRDGTEKKKELEIAPIINNNGNNNIAPWLISGAIIALIALLLLFLKKRKNQFLIS